MRTGPAKPRRAVTRRPGTSVLGGREIIRFGRFAPRRAPEGWTLRWPRPLPVISPSPGSAGARSLRCGRPTRRGDPAGARVASRLRALLAADRRGGGADDLGPDGAPGDGLRRDRRRSGAERALRDAACGGRVRATRDLAPPVRRPQRDRRDAVRFLGGRRRDREHGLGRVHRADRRADVHGRRDLRRRRPRPAGVRRALLRAAGARGLHRRARPLHRNRPAAEGRRDREALGRHAVGPREHLRRRWQVGVDHGRGRRRRTDRPVRARALRAEAARRDHRRRPLGARGQGAGPRGPRCGDRRRRADRLPVRLALRRVGGATSSICSRAPSRS